MVSVSNGQVSVSVLVSDDEVSVLVSVSDDETETPSLVRISLNALSDVTVVSYLLHSEVNQQVIAVGSLHSADLFDLSAGSLLAQLAETWLLNGCVHKSVW